MCAHLVVAGRVEDVVQGAEAGHQLRVDPELGRAGQAGLASKVGEANILMESGRGTER